jgi:hypothetical protein
MGLLTVDIYSDYDDFLSDYPATEPNARLLWDLLGQLSGDELLVKIPSWLAEEKVGYVEGSAPTEFIGHVEEETADAVKLADAAAARSLMKLAHRIHRLELGEPDGNDWSQRRLEEHRRRFERREDAETLQDKWLPKSQIEHVVRRQSE